MKFPGSDLIVTGADATLSQEFSKSARDLVEEHGPRLFNVGLHPTRRRVDDWELTNGTRVRATGVGGSIIGRGADVLLVDDYFKNVEQALSPTIRRKLLEWYLTTAKTRLSPDGAVVLIATRWHKDDLIGEMIKQQELGGDRWHRICLPAIAEESDVLGRKAGEPLWPNRWTLDRLEQIRKGYELTGYPWQWLALYQQRPPQILDATWGEDLLTGDDLWFDEWPDPSRIQFRVMSLDPSLGATDTSDYSAILMGMVDNSGYVYVDADIARRDPFGITRDSLERCRMFAPHAFAIETNQFQSFLAAYFDEQAQQQGLLVPTVGIHNSQKKAPRIMAGLSPYLNRRQFRFQKAQSRRGAVARAASGLPRARLRRRSRRPGDAGQDRPIRP